MKSEKPVESDVLSIRNTFVFCIYISVIIFNALWTRFPLQCIFYTCN